MKAARTRKLAIWGALPPYLGGKRRLCPLIFREIDRILPRRHWRELAFLDGFLGGGSVSLYAKAQGFRVVSCDIAQRAITVGEALIANSRVRLTCEDVLRLVAATPGHYWWARGLFGEVRSWLCRALDQTIPSSPLYARGLLMAAHLAFVQGDPYTGMRLLAEGESLAQRLGSARELARLCEMHDAYRWLCGGVSVNYHTLSDYRVTKGRALDELMTQILGTLMHEGIVRLRRVAQDGTRVRERRPFGASAA